MSTPERLAERLTQETPLLRQAFPNATIDCEALVGHPAQPPSARRLVTRPHRRAVRHPAQLPSRAAGQHLRPPGPDPRRWGGPRNSQGIQQHAGGPGCSSRTTSTRTTGTRTRTTPRAPTSPTTSSAPSPASRKRADADERTQVHPVRALGRHRGSTSPTPEANASPSH